MRKLLPSIASLVLCAACSYAQNPGQAAATAAARPPGLPQTITLATAKKMVAVAESAAAALDQHIAICVLDTDGDVVLAERMDGADHTPVITAEGKARASLIFGLPTAEIADAIANKKPITANLSSIPVGTGGEVTLQFRGGLPILKNGKVIGAIGIGGSASETDEKFSQAAINAISGK